jgi:predicted Zn finger-like uncharacterized protein
MSMVTQCPHCATAFNVTPDQLFVRDGKVRCGNCKAVFDGLVNLTSVDALRTGAPPMVVGQAFAASPALPVSPLQEQETTAYVAPSSEFGPTEPEPAPIAAAPVTAMVWPPLPAVPEVPIPPLPLEIAAEASRGDAPESETVPLPPTAERVAVPLAATAVVAATQPAQAVEPLPMADTDALPPRRVTWPWAIAAALAALALCGQVLHTFRSEIAALAPGVRPALTQLCEWAQCTVPPLQRPSALAIQASDLLILDNAKPHLVQLIVTMQNQSSLEIGYPAIDLVLNDRFDHAIARRVFVPTEYLRGDDAKKTVIAASVTTTVRIDLDLSALSAGGFGLLLIPAPQT